MDTLVKRRIQRLKKLIETEGNPFQETRYERTSFSTDIKLKFSELEPGQETDQHEKVAGRIRSIRFHGGVAFADLSDYRGTVQLAFRKDAAPDAFRFVEDYLDEGDIVGVGGKVIRTKRGEVSVQVSQLVLLSKALRPLPHEWYGLKDVETRYRQRYLDLLMNKEVREGFAKIHLLVNGMREHLISEEFVEVNTPALQPIYGGAFAKPFKTYHNFLKQDMFLRIAPELYLKKLIVGGFERVFEVATCFRNESVDSRHNPEFIQIEAYQAFADYEDMMELIENMVAAGVKKAAGTTKVEYQGREIDFKPPWKRVTIEYSLKSAGIDMEAMSEKEIIAAAKELGAKAPRLGDAIEELFSDKVQPSMIQPTFVTHFPADISPLAKKFPDNPLMAQRFEAYAGGVEIGNAYSELNNPIEQFMRFREEEKLRRKADEHMPMDKDYVRALEYGLPPTGGLGIGIGRVSSILLDRPSLKEVILFPTVAGIDKLKTVAEMFPKMQEFF